jgi:hypothetical protein
VGHGQDIRGNPRLFYHLLADHHMTAQSVGYVSGCRHPFRDLAGLPNRPAAVTLALPKT